MDNVLYLCDGKADCGIKANFTCGVCNYDSDDTIQCFHTSDPNHAKNGAIKDEKELETDRFDKVEEWYWEVSRNDDGDLSV